MTRVVSVSAHTGPLKVTVQDRQEGVEKGPEKWQEADAFTLQSGEHRTSITLTDTRRLVIEEIHEQPQE